MKTFNINSKNDIAEFFTYLQKELDLNFHPDTPFNDYIDSEGDYLFTFNEVETLESYIEKCFEVCQNQGLDIYEIALDTYNNIHSTNF